MIPIAKPSIGAAEEQAVARVLRTGHIASGPETKCFEQEFAENMGAKHAIAVANGTLAIQATLEALGLGPGDEVIMPAFTFIATANAILYAGGTPVFVDVDPESYCIDPHEVEKAITPRTAGILPVHLYGHPADMSHLGETADTNDLWILGDAAQAHGARLDGKPLGGLGQAQTWSLYPTKNITSGEGGMVTTDDANLADRVRSIANHGRSKPEHGTYDHVRRGSNYRMTDIHAAIGRVQLGHLEKWLAARTRNSAAMTSALEEQSKIQSPQVSRGATHAWHQYTVLSPNRGALRQHLAEHGIGSAIYYPTVMQDFAHLAPYASVGCPVAQRIAQECLSIPIHPQVTLEEKQHIASALQSFV